jgi:hypothetical protein
MVPAEKLAQLVQPAPKNPEYALAGGEQKGICNAPRLRQVKL